MSIIFLGRPLTGRFVIPSGILTTRVPIIEKVAEMIPEVGIITTKSVGVEPEPGYREPILAEEGPLNFINAVGLRSPGMEVMGRELQGMLNDHTDDHLFQGKFILVSIYGKTEKEFSKLVRHLAPVADGFELNLSCPHSKAGYGASIGSHPETTFSFTQAAVEAAKDATSRVVGQGSHDDAADEARWLDGSGKVPVFVKLTPNVEDIGIIAESAVKAGATGITAINTVGPIEYRDPVSGEPVLTHVTGGQSGAWIREVGAHVVKAIREKLGPTIPIIGMGGITSASDVRSFDGADLYGVGSALAGLDLERIAGFFGQLEKELTDHSTPSDSASSLLLDRRLMEYREFRISEIREIDDDLRIFVFDRDMDFLPAQFVFLWLPGKGEKPFSPALNDPLTIAIRKRGILTTEFFDLEEGDRLMVRGPYGRGFLPDGWRNVYILSGGTGSGAALNLAKLAFEQGKEVTVFQGSTSEKQVLFEKEFRKYGRFIPGIDRNGPGEVISVMEYHLGRDGMPEDSVFFNIGPEVMMGEGMRVESGFLPPDRIFASVERDTLCGVGLCGACELNGFRTCIRGTVFSRSQLMTGKNKEEWI